MRLQNLHLLTMSDGFSADKLTGSVAHGQLIIVDIQKRSLSITPIERKKAQPGGY